ncbi:hypothetical protein HD806DRAFT_262087 [Xylariaceae sp. AK1471]|nr:hypothetical protein HD806DRAFT_262087 [Xylariaceae sp. AK1471]
MDIDRSKYWAYLALAVYIAMSQHIHRALQFCGPPVFSMLNTSMKKAVVWMCVKIVKAIDPAALSPSPSSPPPSPPVSAPTLSLSAILTTANIQPSGYEPLERPRTRMVSGSTQTDRPPMRDASTQWEEPTPKHSRAESTMDQLPPEKCKWVRHGLKWVRVLRARPKPKPVSKSVGLRELAEPVPDPMSLPAMPFRRPVPVAPPPPPPIPKLPVFAPVAVVGYPPVLSSSDVPVPTVSPPVLASVPASPDIVPLDVAETPVPSASIQPASPVLASVSTSSDVATVPALVSPLASPVLQPEPAPVPAPELALVVEPKPPVLAPASLILPPAPVTPPHQVLSPSPSVVFSPASPVSVQASPVLAPTPVSVPDSPRLGSSLFSGSVTSSAVAFVPAPAVEPESPPEQQFVPLSPVLPAPASTATDYSVGVPVPADVPLAPHFLEERNAEDSGIHSHVSYSVNTHVVEGESHVSHPIDGHVLEMEPVPVDVPAVTPHLPEERNAEDFDIHSLMLYSVNTHSEGEPHVSHHVDDHVLEVEPVESHSVNALDIDMEPVTLHSGNAADVEMEPAVSHGVDAHGDSYVYMEPVESHSGNALDVDMENGASALSERDVPTTFDPSLDFIITDDIIDFLHDDTLFGSWSSAPVYDHAVPPAVDAFTAPAGDQVNEEAFATAFDDISMVIEDFPSIPDFFTLNVDDEMEEAPAVDDAPIDFPILEWDDSMMRDIEARGYFDDAASHEVVMTEQAPAVPEVENGMDVEYRGQEEKDGDYDMDELFGPGPWTEVMAPTAVPASPAVPFISHPTVGSAASEDTAVDEYTPGLVGAPAPAAVSAVVPASPAVPLTAAVDSASGGAAMVSPTMSPAPTIPGSPMRPVLEPTRVSVKLPLAVSRPRPAQAPIAFDMAASPAAPMLDKRFIINNTPTRPTCNILSLQPGYRPPRKLNVEPRQKEAYVEEFLDNDGFRQKVRWDLRDFPTLDVDALRHTEQLMLDAAEEASKDWLSRQAGIEEQSAIDEAARKKRVDAAFAAKKKRDYEAYKKRLAKKKENPVPSMFIQKKKPPLRR